MQNKQVKSNTILKLHWWHIIRMLQILVASLVWHLISLCQEKGTMQRQLQCELRKNYIVNLRVIRIGLHLIMLSCQTKWGIRVRSVFIITLRNVKKVQFDILHDISENVTLLQLMDSVGNVNNAVSIIGYWIFDSNYLKALPSKLYLLNLIWSPSVGGGIFAMLESVFH